MRTSTLDGQTVRSAREILGLSQTAVARLSGINRTYLSLLESGRFILSPDDEATLREVFEAGGVRLSELEPGPTDSPSTDALTERIRDRVARTLAAEVEAGLLWGCDDEAKAVRVTEALTLMALAFYRSQRARGIDLLSGAQGDPDRCVRHFVAEQLRKAQERVEDKLAQ